MDLITPEIGIFVWSSLVLIMIILPVLSLKNRFKDNDKLIWALVVLLLPIFGSLIYFILGPSKRLR